MTTVLIALTLIPPFFLLWRVYQNDKIEREPPKLLLIIFVLGMLSTIPAGILEMAGASVLELILPQEFINSAVGFRIYNFLFYVIVVGGAEELVKFLAMRIPTWRNKDFNYVFDGVVYGVTAAMGFAALENVLYVLMSENAIRLQTAGWRSWTAIPLHCIAGVFMGHYYGIAKAAERWSDSRIRVPSLRYKIRNRMLCSCILIPMVLHGIYDFILSEENDIVFLSFIVYIIVLDIFAFRSFKKYAKYDTSLQ